MIDFSSEYTLVSSNDSIIVYYLSASASMILVTID